MYFPTFRKKKNGVPVLSKGDIEVIAHNFVRDFQPEALTVPQELKMEEFIECYLGMTPDYQYLSHNGVYLGMTVFNDTDCVPVFCPETNRAEYIHADARTVIIDRRLIEDPKQEHRYRFTLGHEGGHDIFHTAFFAYDPNQTCMFTDAHPPMIQCRIDAGKSSKTDPRYWTDAERMEWQSNYFSSAFMMPSDTVKIVHARNAARTDGLLACRKVTLREKLLLRLFGPPRRLMVLVPGDSVDTISITEVAGGGGGDE